MQQADQVQSIVGYGERPCHHSPSNPTHQLGLEFVDSVPRRPGNESRSGIAALQPLEHRLVEHPVGLGEDHQHRFVSGPDGGQGFVHCVNLPVNLLVAGVNHVQNQAGVEHLGQG